MECQWAFLFFEFAVHLSTYLFYGSQTQYV